MASDEGASPREVILECCRRNNTELLEETIADLGSTASQSGKRAEEYVAEVLNKARDGVGNGCLHLAATHGNVDILDLLLDQEGVEIDEMDRMEQDTPLHKAVRFVNSLDQSEWLSAGHPVVDILLDAGCDPRIRNKAKLKPVELVDPRNAELRSMLQRQEFAMQAGGDVVQEDDDGDGGGVGSIGSASDSD